MRIIFKIATARPIFLPIVSSGLQSKRYTARAHAALRCNLITTIESLSPLSLSFTVESENLIEREGVYAYNVK